MEAFGLLEGTNQHITTILLFSTSPHLQLFQDIQKLEIKYSAFETPRLVFLTEIV